MNSRQRRLAHGIYSVYGWVFVASGLLGILGSHLEPSLLHRLVVLPEQREAMASLVHQLRFLRGAELGFGLVMLAAKDAFFTASTGRRAPLTRAVLAGLFAAPAARTVSLLLDGPPAPLWTALLVIEWGVFLLLRRASEPRPAPGDSGHDGAPGGPGALRQDDASPAQE